MNKMKITALLLLLFFPHGKALGQGDSALLARIESSIARTDPKWKLVRKSQTRRGDYASFDWKTGKSSVYVFFAFKGSAEDAAKALKNLPGFFEDGGLRMTILPTTIPDLGDENYAWEDCCDKRFRGVAFRKGKVVVHVSAPSIEIAQRFASHVAAALTVNTSP